MRQLLQYLQSCIYCLQFFREEYMAENFRMTATFSPKEENRIVQYTTESKLLLPNKKFSKVTWKRSYGDYTENLIHLDNQSYYQCTQLDAEFIVQANLEYSKLSQNSQKETKFFGPIQREKQVNVSTLNEYSVQMITNLKTYQCRLSFHSNQIQLKTKASLNQTVYHISMHDIGICYVSNQHDNVIIFPSLFQRIIGLKLFNQILLVGGNYSQNNDPLKIKIKNHQEYQLTLIKLNSMKIQKSRRGSHLSTFKCKKNPKPSIISTEAKKSSSDIKQDTQDSFRIIGKQKTAHQPKNLKTSQLINKPKQSMAPSDGDYAVSLQGQSNYFSEFQNIIFADEKQGEALLLNQSFEQLQNKSSQKEIMILESIRRKKQLQGISQEQKLRLKLNDLHKQKTELSQMNEKLKVDVQRLRRANQNSNPFTIKQLQGELSALRKQFEQVSQCTSPKSNQYHHRVGMGEPRTPSAVTSNIINVNNNGNKFLLSKHKSNKQLMMLNSGSSANIESQMTNPVSKGYTSPKSGHSSGAYGRKN